jgi:hypothetical protein
MIIERMKMKIIKLLLLAVLLLALLALLGACGTSSSNTASPVYKVEYLPGAGMNAPVQGKTVFQLKITKQSDGSAATGLNPSLTLLMHMTNGDSHATPVDSVKESGTPGTYDCTVYYLMASGPTMGTWDMNITVGGETTTFHPDVAMAMGSETVRTTLYGSDDIVTAMSGTTYNKYYIFRDGMISASMPTLKLFLSHSENMMMDFTSVSVGSVLSSPTGTVISMIVTASTDSTFPATTGVTVAGTDKSDGHWELSGLSSLSTAGTYTVYVKLQVNGQDKTTDGKTASSENKYATFSVTSGM